MRSPNGSFFTSFLTAVLLLMWPLTAVAQEASTPAVDNGVLIAIYPKDKADGERFETEAAPGESVTLTAVLVNFGSEPIDLRTYASDVIPATNGGMKIAPRGSELNGPSLWMSFDEEEFTLQPQESIERPLTITIPDDAAPGQYVNAVALETVNPVNEGQSGSFDQYFRKVVSVYITVPGDLTTDFNIGDPEVLVMEGRAGMQLPITNSGQVRIDVAGHVTVTSADGSVVHDGDIVLGPIYMGQETYIQIPFASVPPAGDYTLTYTFADNHTGVERSSEAQAIVIPEVESTEVAPIAFENVVVEANADPIVFANVSVDVSIAEASYRSTRLTLSVSHNGEHVEDFVLADNLSLAQGTTSVSQRYLPATNWESGEYTFALKLESTEGGQTSMLFEEADVATLEVP